YTYIDQDKPGVNVLEAKGYQLQNVNRSHETVPGELSILPGNQVLAFYPGRDLAYNADVFVEVQAEGRSLLRSRFKTRVLPTFIQGGVSDQFGQPVPGLEVAIPGLGRRAVTNKDGAFSFGFGDQPGDTLKGGRYEIVVNPGLKGQGFGELRSWVNLDEGRRNRLGQLHVPALNREVAFSPVSGGRELNLLQGAIKLDLNDARLQFPDGRDRGDVHAQFQEFTQIQYPVEPIALPQWVYSLQPAGVRVEGDWSLNLEIPKLNNEYRHVPPDNTPVLLVGLDSASRMIVPVGVGRIKNYRVISEGKLTQNTLDILGYAFVSPQALPFLEQYVRNEISLVRLLAEIRSARLRNASNR
ncbi:MAG: carboxypeptidase-like regulatory domain-containing protein, partial [Endozoicomonas sp.]